MLGCPACWKYFNIVGRFLALAQKIKFLTYGRFLGQVKHTATRLRARPGPRPIYLMRPILSGEISTILTVSSLLALDIASLVKFISMSPW